MRCVRQGGERNFQSEGVRCKENKTVYFIKVPCLENLTLSLHYMVSICEDRRDSITI